MNGMMKYENEDDDDFLEESNPFIPNNFMKANPATGKETSFLEQVKKFTIVAPSEFTFKQLERFINDKIKNIDELEKLYKRKTYDVYIDYHCYFDNSYDYPTRDMKNQAKSLPTKSNSQKFVFSADPKDGEFDYSMTLENWVKKR